MHKINALDMAMGVKALHRESVQPRYKGRLPYQRQGIF